MIINLHCQLDQMLDKLGDKLRGMPVWFLDESVEKEWGAPRGEHPPLAGVLD